MNPILRFNTTPVFLLFINVFLAFNTDAKIQPVVLLTDTTRIVLTPDEVFYFIDSTNSIPREEILSGKMNDFFIPIPPDRNYTIHLKKNYWIRFKLKNTCSYTKKWVLELPDPHISELTFFRPGPDGQYEQLPPSGFHFPFRTKEYQHKNFVFDLHFPQNSDSAFTYYILVNSDLFSSLTLQVRDEIHFSDYALEEYLLLGLFYGILLIMSIYNLFLYFNTREYVYLFYILYAFGCALNSFSEDGLGFQYIWPDHPAMNGYVMIFTPLFLLTAFIIYSFSFLNIGGFDSKFKTAILVAYALNIVMFVIEHFIYKTPIRNPLYLLPFLLIYISSFRIYLNGYKPARFFILAYSFIIVSFIIFQLRRYGWVPTNVFTVYSFNFGFLAEVVILSIALGDRLRIEKEQKEIIQEKVIIQLQENESLKNKLIQELKEKEIILDTVNKELEIKVSERTVDLQSKTNELGELNGKLSKLVEDLNQMNIRLDLDNWQLKQQVQEEVKARLSDEELSTVKFKNLFPDEPTCLRYLENLKWADGFVCKKCGHDRYIVHTSPFTRKCTSCKHVESVTAETLFHGVRIPIDKAFYIVYDTIRSGKSKTLEELSELLEINKNTIWAFRKKVQTSYDLLKPKSKGGVKWDDLLIK